MVNGVSWPSLDVAQARYRFRLLNGCNARTLNLAMFVVNPDGTLGQEIPFYQIGAEQGLLPQVVKTQTGLRVALPGDGTIPSATPDPTDQTALLMGLAERADVIVDFSGLPDGTVVRMTNTAPDQAYGGFPAEPADPSTTGQVMQFVVDAALTGAPGSTDGTTTAPESLVLPAEDRLGATENARQVSLSEREDSDEVCVPADADGNYVLNKRGQLKQIRKVKPGPDFEDDCAAVGGVPYGPIIDTLGTVTGTGVGAVGVPLKWTDTTGTSTPVTVFKVNGTPVTVLVTENPTLGTVGEWQIHNFTPDAHPIHLHLVRFEVVSRTMPDGSPSSHPVEPWEAGFKDTVMAYPGEITTVKAHFDIEGLYVWHCHILEHEDNEMMRPFVVSAP